MKNLYAFFVMFGCLALWACSSNTQNSNSAQIQKENYEVLIGEIYSTLLNRAADPMGLESWKKALESGESIDDIKKFLATSQEYYQLKIEGKEPAMYVETIFRDLTGKPPSTSEFRSAIDRINNGSLEWKGLVEEIL